MINLFTIMAACFLSACSLNNPGSTGSPNAEFQAGLTDVNVEYQVPGFSASPTAPIIVQPISDSATLTVWQVERTGQQIRVHYTYEQAGEPTNSRILLAHEDGEYFLVYDSVGTLVSGYSTSLEKDGDILFTYINNNALFTISTNEDSNSPIVLTLTADPGRESVAFSDQAQMGQAAKLLRQVDSGLLIEDSLSTADQELLAKVREVQSWAAYLPHGDIGGVEIDALSALTDNVQIVGPDDGEMDPLDGVSWVVWLCRVAKIAKYVCEYVGDNQICKWITVVDAACTAAGIR